jgi:hypothetical protein
MAKDHDDSGVRCTGKTAAGKPCRNAVIEGTTRCYHHSFKVPGRPSKMTPDVCEAIVDALLDGAYLETAAAAVGLDERTLHAWLARGRKSMDSAIGAAEELGNVEPDMDAIYNGTDPANWPYIDFARAAMAAQAHAEIELLRRIVRGKGVGWQRHLAILERRYQSRWRLRSEQQMTEDVEAGLPKVQPVAEDGREKILELLREAVPTPAVEKVKAKRKAAAKK